MPLPSLLAASTTVAPPGGKHKAVSPIAGKAKFLGMTVEQQKQDNWCWSALAVSVRKFLSGDVVEQCEQVNKQLRRATCCNDQASCNVAFILDRTLFSPAGGVFSFDQVKQQIDSGRPLAVQILWNGGGNAHFLCIDGYNNAGAAPLLSIKDPIYGPSMTPYDALVSAYQGSGLWNASYLT